MSQYIRRFTTPAALGLALALGLGACGGAGDGSEDALAADSSLTRDLALAGSDSMAQPALSDTFTAPVAVEPAPSAPAATPAPRPNTSRPAPRPAPAKPAPTPAKPAPKDAEPAAPPVTASGNTVRQESGAEAARMGTIASGTQISLTANQNVCTNTHKVGDRFTATVANTVNGTDGASIPAGATAVVRVTELKRSENANDPIRMGFEVISVSFDGKSYAVSARTSSADVARVRSSSRENDAKKVIGGAVIGAIAGQVLGKDTKGTVIGAATGAAAGTAAAAATANYEGCLNEGAPITIVLTEATTVPVG